CSGRRSSPTPTTRRPSPTTTASRSTRAWSATTTRLGICLVLPHWPKDGLECRAMRLGALGCLAVLLLTGCGTPTPPAASQSSIPTAPAEPKRMTLAVLVNPRDFRDSRARPFPQLVVGGLTIKDEKGTRRPQIAEDIP